MALVITDSNFEESVSANDLLVLDFWAQWCGPCKALAPTIDELSKAYEGKVAFGKVDIDENPELIDKFGIRNVPTIIYLKKGEQVDKHVGAMPKATIEKTIQGLM